MRTPSLTRRMVLGGTVTVVLIAVFLDLLVYFSWSANLRRSLVAELEVKEDLVRAEAVARGADDLAIRLDEVGVLATIRSPSGEEYRAGPRRSPDDAFLTREIALPRGMSASLAVPTAEADRSLRRVLLAEAGGTVLAAVLAFLLLRLVSEFAVRPLDAMVTAIRRTAAGQRGERLRPEPRDTKLGVLAGAYDDMLDALEAALQDADEAAERSQRLQERAQKIVETAGDAYVAADASGTIIGWNSRAEAVFGWTAGEAIGRALAETLVPESSRAAHLAGFERFLAGQREGRMEGRPTELMALHRQGHVFPVELTLWSTCDDSETLVSAFARDISERREAEREQSRLASIVSSSEEAIIGMGLDCRIVTWNRAAESISGYSASEAVGRSVIFLFPPERRDEILERLKDLGPGKQVAHKEAQWLCKNGTVIDVAMTISPICDRSGTVGASVIARDVTDQRRMAAELEATLGELSAALDEARSSEARTRRFLADAAHQLRTPVAGIQACAEGLLLTTEQAAGDELLAHLAQEAARAGRLIKALLQTARLDQGMAVTRRPCDLPALCEDELDRARSLAPELRLSLAAPGWEDGTLVEFDDHVVREVLGNLLDNARRHARSAIDVRVSARGAEVEIRVSDDGPGLGAEALDQAFERFVSLDGGGGTGLGLSIARGMAEAHGGTLHYEDGSFVLRIPAPPSRAADRDAPASTDGSAQPSRS